MLPGADLIRRGGWVCGGCRSLGVVRGGGGSEEYVPRRVAEAGLTRHPGTFAPRSAWSPDVLEARAGELYGM